ncbi:MAG: hypothetical protein M3018_13280 [Actinomycetota bacterium]|nr:hypothetical protein [Actinomycetota bacterium]
MRVESTAKAAVLDLRSDQIHHHELLIRMLDERGEMIPPATFLYIAERFGLIARIDNGYAQGHHIGTPVPIEALIDTQLRASEGESASTGLDLPFA